MFLDVLWNYWDKARVRDWTRARVKVRARATG